MLTNCFDFFFFAIGARFPPHNGGSDSFGFVQEYLDFTADQKNDEAQVLDGGVPGGQVVLPLWHGARRVPEDGGPQLGPVHLRHEIPPPDLA